MTEDYKRIDINDAVARLGLDETKVEKLLKMFLDGNLLERTKNAFKENNIEEASKNIHSIKGTAANIGAIGLSKLALDIELKIKKDNYLDFNLLNIMEEVWKELKTETNNK